MFFRSSHPRFALLAWTTLVWNILTILWGAVVRATGSGAGCGSHWPLCNGVVVPLEAGTATLIEFSHRMTSAVALVLVFWVLVRARRVFKVGHPVRAGASWSFFLILVEAAVGAALVLLGLVEDNASVLRAVYMGVHLTNTLFLLAALALTASWSSRDGIQPFRERESTGFLYVLGVFLVLVTGVSGAIAALGDTLFPASSLVEGFNLDFGSGTHFLLRLRLLHPPIAVVAGLTMLLLARRAGAGGDRLRSLGRSLVFLVVLQVLAGMLNLILLVPIWLQVLHLFLADMLWIVLVIYGDALAEGPFLRYRSGLS